MTNDWRNKPQWIQQPLKLFFSVWNKWPSCEDYRGTKTSCALSLATTNGLLPEDRPICISLNLALHRSISLVWVFSMLIYQEKTQIIKKTINFYAFSQFGNKMRPFMIISKTLQAEYFWLVCMFTEASKLIRICNLLLKL